MYSLRCNLIRIDWLHGTGQLFEPQVVQTQAHAILEPSVAVTSGKQQSQTEFISSVVNDKIFTPKEDLPFCSIVVHAVCFVFKERYKQLRT